MCGCLWHIVLLFNKMMIISFLLFKNTNKIAILNQAIQVFNFCYFFFFFWVLNNIWYLKYREYCVLFISTEHVQNCWQLPIYQWSGSFDVNKQINNHIRCAQRILFHKRKFVKFSSRRFNEMHIMLYSFEIENKTLIKWYLIWNVHCHHH